jgi:hypothetical protein
MHNYFTRFVDQGWKEMNVERWVTMASLCDGVYQSSLILYLGVTSSSGFQSSSGRTSETPIVHGRLLCGLFPRIFMATTVAWQKLSATSMIYVIGGW